VLSDFSQDMAPVVRQLIEIGKGDEVRRVATVDSRLSVMGYREGGGLRDPDSSAPILPGPDLALTYCLWQRIL
jgi:hypothetical protein